MEDELDPIYERRRSRRRIFAYLVLLLLCIGVIVLWFSRITVADNFIRSELAKRNVSASYEIVDIGFRKQIIRNLVIGDPQAPDLTADLVEIGNSLGTEGAGIDWVRARSVKAYGRLKDGKLTFGALDKFSDPEDDSPLAFPDISLVVEKGQMRIDTDYGAIGLALNGSGNLHDGFSGELAALTREMALGGCTMSGASYFGEISINDRKPRLKGPLRLPVVKCPDLDLAAQDMGIQLSVELGQDFTSWTGDAGIRGGPLRFADFGAKTTQSTIGFKGDLKGSSGDINLASGALNSPYGSAVSGRLNGTFQIGYGADPVTARFDGQPEIRSARLSSNLMQQTTDLATSTNGTPVGPLAEKLASAMRQAGRDLDISGDVRFDLGANETRLAINEMNARSRSGARLELDDPVFLLFARNDVKMLAEGNLVLNGGGFPDAIINLNDGSLSRGFDGNVQMAAYRAGSANLIIPRLAFAPAAQGGTNFDGRFLLTGPLADGQITELQVPVSGYVGEKGNFILFRKCVDLQFTSLRISNFIAGPTRTRLCPEGGRGIVSGSGAGMNIAANAPSFNLTGRLGETPMVISSGGLSFSMKNGASAQNVSIRLGTAESLTWFDMDRINAVFGPTLSGTISGGEGKIVNVPLLMNDIEGDWRYIDGAFLADAQLRVRDEQQVERFRPLIGRNVALKFAGGQISATGLLQEPTTGRQVANVDIVHIFDDSSGEAVIDVGGLIFDKQFQPELLTPVLLGVIANVEGTVTGIGRINWGGEEGGVRSTGTFRTDSTNFAAAFGPVTGLSGEISFTDLLGLETGPGQYVQMQEINPGVAAYNGQMFYRLLPDYKMQIEGGQWPFAGGMLYLEPTIIDLAEDVERRLEFTVVGVDAAQVLSQFEFENLNATGIFDGKLPMVFDQEGGRIVGGYLVAREGGGSLAYVGELTYKDVGTYANFAFNALKSLQYEQLTIGMDGAIDGEMITEVKFSGIQQGAGASKNFITNQVAKLPLQFNVRIQAPFMQLLSSVKSYYEPELLVGRNLPALLRAQEERATEAAKILKDEE